MGNVIGRLVIVAIFVYALIALPIWPWFALSEENVSGIVYNTKNNEFPMGNTSFSVRASVDTYTNEQNQSSYCLPPDSPYKELVNKAAVDKEIKVNVTTKKGFWWVKAFQCVDNVTVTEVKK